MRPQSCRLWNSVSPGLTPCSVAHETSRIMALLIAAMSIVVAAGCGGNQGLSPDGSRLDVSMGSAGDTGTISTDAPGHCSISHDQASIRVVLGDGSSATCYQDSVERGPDGGLDGGSSGATDTLVGMITGGDSSSLVIDTCDGNQSCVPNGVQIAINAPGLDLTTIPHSRVKVTYTFFNNLSYWCTAFLEITTADSLDGPTPTGSTGQLLLAVADGVAPSTDGVIPSINGSTPSSSSPYRAIPTPLGCSSDTACPGGYSPPTIPPPDDYALEFSMLSDANSTVRVYMGQTVPWTTGGRSYKIRNLRSFQGCETDDFGEFAYYIVVTP